LFVNGGHFLVWLPFASKSVKIGFIDIIEELGEKGHDITIVSGYKSKKALINVKEIYHESNFTEVTEDFTSHILDGKGNVPLTSISNIMQESINSGVNALKHPEVVAMFAKNEIDVILTAPFFANEAAYFLAHKYNASLATLLTGIVAMPPTSWAVGDIYNPSFVPNGLLGLPPSMSFSQRFINTLATVGFYLLVNVYTRPNTEEMLREQFPEDLIPKLSSLAENVALNINHGSPFLADGMRPVMPKTILGALMTCNGVEPLSGDLKKFVTGAEHGVIFMSFGSVLKASKMPKSKKDMFLSVFSKLKQRVIWKWDEEMPEASSNVLVSSWLPQQALLAHNNVKLIISHGGAGSFQEAICHQTPIVGIPLDGDQKMNINEVVLKGIGLKLDWNSITEEALLDAVNKILNDDKYSNEVAKLKDVLLDQPLHPLENTVWWLEYLLRHPGNKRMRSPALDLYWFQYFLLDVLLAIISIMFTVLAILYLAIRFCVNICRRKLKTE